MGRVVVRVRRGIVLGRSDRAVGLAAAAVVGLNAELVAVAAARGPADIAWAPIALAVGVLALAALLRPIEPAPGEKFSLAAAAALFGAIVLPAPFAVTAVSSAALVAKVTQRRSLRNTAVNVAQASGATAAAAIALDLGGTSGAWPVATASVSYLAVTLGSVALMIAASQGTRQALAFLDREWLPTAALLGIGGVAGLAWSRDPLAIVLFLPVLVAISRSVRRVRERSATDAAERPADVAYDIAHELRTPLAAVLSDLAYIEGPLTATERDALASARHGAQRLADLTDRLLLLGRIERAGTRAEEASVLSAARSAVASFPLHDRVDLVVDVDPALSAAMPAGLLELAVRDLVANALAYTPEGAVHVTARKEATDVVLTVSDTGIGIPPDELPHVFDRFYRGKRARELASGTGLGLAIVRRVVEAHRGSIELESAPGRGTRVVVRLPSG